MFENKWKLSFFISILILITSNVFWLFGAIDQAISYSYLSDESHRANESIKELSSLIIKGADKYSQKDILYLLRQANPDSFIVEDGNKIITDFSTFTFKNGKLISVK